MEWIPENGHWRDERGKVYQESQMLPNDYLAVGYSDYGRPGAHKDLRVDSHSDGFWVMDNLGSLHRHPFKSAENAERYQGELLKLWESMEV